MAVNNSRLPGAGNDQIVQQSLLQKYAVILEKYKHQRKQHFAKNSLCSTSCKQYGSSFSQFVHVDGQVSLAHVHNWNQD